MTTGPTYTGDLWVSREPGDLALTGSVRLMATPGHTNEDITTLAATADGVYACTHAWWARTARRSTRSAPTRRRWSEAGSASSGWPR
jgi:hypothetical protein